MLKIIKKSKTSKPEFQEEIKIQEELKIPEEKTSKKKSKKSKEVNND